MLRSYWREHPEARLGALIVVAVCALTLGYGLLESSDYERQAAYNAGDYAKHTGDKVAQTCVRITPAEKAQCLSDAFEAQREYEYNQADLVAQRQSALWAYLMAAAAIIGMGLSAVGVALVWTTFRATQKGNEIAQSVASNAIKPHIYPEAVVFTETGSPMLVARITLKNYGGGVAKRIRVFARDYKINAGATKLWGFQGQQISLPDIPPQGIRKLFRYFPLSEEVRGDVESGATVLVIRMTYSYCDELGSESRASFAFCGDLKEDDGWYLFDMETLTARREVFGRLDDAQRTLMDELQDQAEQDANHETHPE